MAALQPGAPAERPPAGIATTTPGLPGASPTSGAATLPTTVSPVAPTTETPSFSTPESPSVAPTVAPLPTFTPEATSEALPTLVLPTPPALSNEARWRAQQIDRIVLEPPQTYRTTSSDLWWYDPVNQQAIILGTIAGDFTVQAEFVLRSQGRDALEVPYQVNQSYGLTALSPAIVERIAAAGYTEWIETYVFRASNVVRR